MNDTAQRTHTSRLLQLTARVQVLEDLVEHHTEALLRFLPATAAELDDVRAQHADLRLAVTALRSQWSDAQCALNTICGWSFWQRLRWVLTGRRA